jgi:hypothetical protein
MPLRLANGEAHFAIHHERGAAEHLLFLDAWRERECGAYTREERLESEIAGIRNLTVHQSVLYPATSY